MARRVVDRLRVLVLLTPWVSVPLALLGIGLALTWPLVFVTSLGWICAPVEVVAAAGLALWMRPRYQVAVLDSSPLGIFTWLQARPPRGVLATPGADRSQRSR